MRLLYYIEFENYKERRFRGFSPPSIGLVSVKIFYNKKQRTKHYISENGFEETLSNFQLFVEVITVIEYSNNDLV